MPPHCAGSSFLWGHCPAPPALASGLWPLAYLREGRSPTGIPRPLQRLLVRNATLWLCLARHPGSVGGHGNKAKVGLCSFAARLTFP